MAPRTAASRTRRSGPRRGRGRWPRVEFRCESERNPWEAGAPPTSRPRMGAEDDAPGKTGWKAGPTQAKPVPQEGRDHVASHRPEPRLRPSPGRAQRKRRGGRPLLLRRRPDQPDPGSVRFEPGHPLLPLRRPALHASARRADRPGRDGRRRRRLAREVEGAYNPLCERGLHLVPAIAGTGERAPWIG